MDGCREKRMKRKLCFFLLFIILAVPGIICAQDSHYWTNAYGTRGQLVGGVVIGSIVDLSSTYYNPGAITKTHDTNLIITTSAFELTSIKVEDVFGGGRILKPGSSGWHRISLPFDSRERRKKPVCGVISHPAGLKIE